MKMLGLLGLLAVLPIISACAGNKGSDESRKEKNGPIGFCGTAYYGYMD